MTKSISSQSSLHTVDSSRSSLHTVDSSLHTVDSSLHTADSSVHTVNSSRRRSSRAAPSSQDGRFDGLSQRSSSSSGSYRSAGLTSLADAGGSRAPSSRQSGYGQASSYDTASGLSRSTPDNRGSYPDWSESSKEATMRSALELNASLTAPIESHPADYPQPLDLASQSSRGSELNSAASSWSSRQSEMDRLQQRLDDLRNFDVTGSTPSVASATSEDSVRSGQSSYTSAQAYQALSSPENRSSVSSPHSITDSSLHSITDSSLHSITPSDGRARSLPPSRLSSSQLPSNNSTVEDRLSDWLRETGGIEYDSIASTESKRTVLSTIPEEGSDWQSDSTSPSNARSLPPSQLSSSLFSEGNSTVENRLRDSVSVHEGNHSDVWDADTSIVIDKSSGNIRDKGRYIEPIPRSDNGSFVSGASTVESNLRRDGVSTWTGNVSHEDYQNAQANLWLRETGGIEDPKRRGARHGGLLDGTSVEPDKSYRPWSEGYDVAGDKSAASTELDSGPSLQRTRLSDTQEEESDWQDDNSSGSFSLPSLHQKPLSTIPEEGSDWQDDSSNRSGPSDRSSSSHGSSVSEIARSHGDRSSLAQDGASTVSGGLTETAGQSRRTLSHASSIVGGSSRATEGSLAVEGSEAVSEAAPSRAKPSKSSKSLFNRYILKNLRKNNK